MALILINLTNPRLVYAYPSQEEANTLDISQSFSLWKKKKKEGGKGMRLAGIINERQYITNTASQDCN